MSYKNLDVAAEVANFPAYKIVRRKVNKHGHYQNGLRHTVEFTDIVSFEPLCVSKKDYYIEYQAATVIACALKNNDDPLEAVDRARRLHHELHWISQCAVVISAYKSPQVTMTLLEHDMVVRLEGILFTVKVTHGGEHIKLVPLDLPSRKD